MAHYKERIRKYNKEKQELIEKMKPLKEKLAPLQKRYTQVCKNLVKTEWEENRKKSE